MGSIHRFIADPSEPCEVLGWFRSLPSPPTEVPTERGFTLHFKQCGPLTYEANGRISQKASPVATLFLPRVRRGVLWTVGEAHFLATPLRSQFPDLHKISSAFSKWLVSFECVYSNKRKDNEFSYYLEGSVKNYDPPVYGFTSGLCALKSGRYFIGDDDNEYVLESICKMLRLRGVDCAGA